MKKLVATLVAVAALFVSAQAFALGDAYIGNVYAGCYTLNACTFQYRLRGYGEVCRSFDLGYVSAEIISNDGAGSATLFTPVYDQSGALLTAGSSHPEVPTRRDSTGNPTRLFKQMLIPSIYVSSTFGEQTLEPAGVSRE